MGQQFDNGENTRPIKRAGVIRPKEMVTVYATAILGDHKSNGYKTGDPMEVHRVLADKLVEAGKATREDPNAKKEGGKK